MFHDIDLRALAEREGPERAFMSLYLAGPESLNGLKRRIEKVRTLLDDEAEREHFEENLRLAREHLESWNFDGRALALFVCWAEDYLEAFPLEREVEDLLWVDSSPYIRPLAELQDEYENFVVVRADNERTRLYFVTSAVAKEAASVRGDVKHNTKKGGWSQKRYERRRDTELQHYAQDVVDKLEALDRQADFRRIVLLGEEETLTAFKDALPKSLSDKVAGEEALNIDAEDDRLWSEAFDLYFEEERASEKRLWEQIKDAYMQGGRGAVGPAEVLDAATVGRVEQLIVTRDARIPCIRCRACEYLAAGASEMCPVCGSEDVFKEDLVEELVALVTKSSGETEFSDPIGGLSEAGDVAALLRY